MILLQALSGINIQDEDFLDVQTITDAMMTTSQSLAELGIRFFLNLLACWAIVHFFYYKKSKRRDYYFTYLVFSSSMLLLLYIMGNVELGVGLTLGLFAIFGVIRYRTETVPIREMTYLFVIIALAAVNGLAPIYKITGVASGNPHYALNAGALAATVLSNLLMLILIGVLENERLLKHTSTKLVLYDRIENIIPEKEEELVADIEKRVGVKVDDIEVGHVDLLKDAAFVKVYYTLKKDKTATIDNLTKAKNFVEQ